MAKDSYWFAHDSTAGRGIKLRTIQALFKHEGKGYYWDVVEVLRDQDGYVYGCTEEHLFILGSLIGINEETYEKTFKKWFQKCVEIGLFCVEENVFFSPVLTEKMRFWEKQKRNGSKGGRPVKTQNKPKKPSGLRLAETQTLAKNNQDSIYRIDNITYVEYLEFLNFSTGKKYRGADRVRKSFYARLAEGYTMNDFKTAISNAARDPYHVGENFKYITPEFFTRQDKLDKFMNYDSKMPAVATQPADAQKKENDFMSRLG